MSKENITTYFLDLDNPPPLTPEQIAMLDRLDAMPDEEIDYSDIPKHDFPPRPPKKTGAFSLDEDVLEWLGGFGKDRDAWANVILRHEMLKRKGETARARAEEAEKAAHA